MHDISAVVIHKWNWCINTLQRYELTKEEESRDKTVHCSTLS